MSGPVPHWPQVSLREVLGDLHFWVAQAMALRGVAHTLSSPEEPRDGSRKAWGALRLHLRPAGQSQLFALFTSAISDR